MVFELNGGLKDNKLILDTGWLSTSEMFTLEVLIQRMIILKIKMLNALSHTQETGLMRLPTMFIQLIARVEMEIAKLAGGMPFKTGIIRVTLQIMSVQG